MIASLLTVFVGCGGSTGTTASDRPLATNVDGQIPDTGNPRGDAGTIAFDANATWNASDPTNTLLLMAGGPEWSDRYLSVLRTPSYLRLLFVNGMGQEYSVGISTDGWVAGEPHLITSTWGAGVERVYVDGQLIGQLDYQGTLELPPGTPVYLGSDGQGVPSATDPISNVVVYNRPLTPEEVAKLAGPAVVSSTPAASRTPVEPSTSDVTLRVQSTSIAEPDSAGTVCVEMIGGTGVVAGTQNDLGWDPSCMEISQSCGANPQHGKSVFTSQRGGPRLRTLVFSFTNTDPIDDGVLYCCPFHIASIPSGTCCAVRVQDAAASDSHGLAIPVEAIGGQICLR